jgi:hypothetical protein
MVGIRPFPYYVAYHLPYWFCLLARTVALFLVKFKMQSLILLCALLAAALVQCAPQNRLATDGPLKQPFYDGNMTDVDKNAAVTAWEGAYKSIVASTTKDDRYVKWFGPMEEGRIDTIQGTYLDMKKAMESLNFTLHFNAQGCERNEFAETSFGSTEIYLCKGYHRADTTKGFNSKLGTIIHSLAVAVGNKEDFPRIDTPDECVYLAEDVPSKAIRSAYNYEYYCEEILK